MPPSSPRFPAADVQSQPRQRRVWARVAAVAVLLLGACTLAVWVGLARPGLDPRDAWQAWHERAPSDLVRHAERRLMGHTRLQALLQPVLDHVRGKIERPDVRVKGCMISRRIGDEKRAIAAEQLVDGGP